MELPGLSDLNTAMHLPHNPLTCMRRCQLQHPGNALPCFSIPALGLQPLDGELARPDARLRLLVNRQILKILEAFLVTCVPHEIQNPGTPQESRFPSRQSDRLAIQQMMLEIVMRTGDILWTAPGASKIMTKVLTAVEQKSAASANGCGLSMPSWKAVMAEMFSQLYGAKYTEYLMGYFLRSVPDFGGEEVEHGGTLKEHIRHVERVMESIGATSAEADKVLGMRTHGNQMRQLLIAKLADDRTKKSLVEALIFKANLGSAAPDISIIDTTRTIVQTERTVSDANPSAGLSLSKCFSNANETAASVPYSLHPRPETVTVERPEGERHIPAVIDEPCTKHHHPQSGSSSHNSRECFSTICGPFSKSALHAHPHAELKTRMATQEALECTAHMPADGDEVLDVPCPTHQNRKTGRCGHTLRQCRDRVIGLIHEAEQQRQDAQLPVTSAASQQMIKGELYSFDGPCPLHRDQRTGRCNHTLRNCFSRNKIVAGRYVLKTTNNLGHAGQLYGATLKRKRRGSTIHVREEQPRKWPHVCVS